MNFDELIERVEMPNGHLNIPSLNKLCLVKLQDKYMTYQNNPVVANLYLRNYNGAQFQVGYTIDINNTIYFVFSACTNNYGKNIRIKWTKKSIDSWIYIDKLIPLMQTNNY